MCTSIDTQPGKFEGESCITHYAYHWLLEGDGDIESNGNGHSETLLLGPFDVASIVDYSLSDSVYAILCDECFRDITNATNILLTERSDGFVTSETNVDVADWEDYWKHWHSLAD